MRLRGLRWKRLRADAVGQRSHTASHRASHEVRYDEVRYAVSHTVSHTKSHTASHIATKTQELPSTTASNSHLSKVTKVFFNHKSTFLSSKTIWRSTLLIWKVPACLQNWAVNWNFRRFRLETSHKDHRRFIANDFLKVPRNSTEHHVRYRNRVTYMSTNPLNSSPPDA